MMRIMIIMTLSPASSGFVDNDADAYDNHGDNSVLAFHKNKLSLLFKVMIIAVC